MNKPLIGFIGQGFIGKNYADDFEARGYSVVRYALEEPYRQNREKIAGCDIVFIAVPTPTLPKGFDFSTVRSVLALVGREKTAVIKSTILPGTTETLQKEYPDIFVFHSPEFLREVTAAQDAAHPDRNIVGVPVDNTEYREKANAVLSVLPPAPFTKICSTKEAELIKYAGNNFFYTKVVYMNLISELAEKLGCNWEVIRDAVVGDPRIGASHMNPIHSGGRGAGGHCFIKDFAAMRSFFKEHIDDELGLQVLQSMEKKNIALLRESGKDEDLLSGVYGKKESAQNS
jgi:UDPglucose 6-dehydrogenase